MMFNWWSSICSSVSLFVKTIMLVTFFCCIFCLHWCCPAIQFAISTLACFSRSSSLLYYSLLEQVPLLLVHSDILLPLLGVYSFPFYIVDASLHKSFQFLLSSMLYPIQSRGSLISLSIVFIFAVALLHPIDILPTNMYSHPIFICWMNASFASSPKLSSSSRALILLSLCARLSLSCHILPLNVSLPIGLSQFLLLVKINKNLLLITLIIFR